VEKDDKFEETVRRSLKTIESSVIDIAATLSDFRKTTAEKIEALETEVKGLRNGVIKQVVAEAIRTVPCPALVGISGPLGNGQDEEEPNGREPDEG